MPVRHAVKRNALSSKWGVWTTDTDARSPVENLIAEFKNNEDAESYVVRIEAGEAHDVIVASLKRKKPKVDGGGGMFGKLFKRGSGAVSATADGGPTVKNPVIEIPAPRRQEAEANTAAIAEAPAASRQARAARAARAAEAPSRFQVIEQPARKPAPVPTVAEAEPAVMAEPVPAVAETEPAVITAESEEPPVVANVPVVEDVPVAVEIEMVETYEAPQPTLEAEMATETISPVEPTVHEAAAGPSANAKATKRVVPEIETVVEDDLETGPSAPEESSEAEEPVPTVTGARRGTVGTSTPPAVKSVEEEPSRDDSLLVDWTFSPPPDVTPEELRSVGGAVPASLAKAPEAPVAETARTSAKTDGGSGISSDPGTGRVSVDICVSKALKDLSSGDPRISDKKYNSIASKEYTEVSKAFAIGNSPEFLREELTHLAAVCLAWADAIEKRRDTGTERLAA